MQEKIWNFSIRFFFLNKCKDGFDTIKISFVALFGC